jgi:PII-like signaling protein
MKPITMVRVYLTESEGKLNNLLNYLHDKSKVRGVTVMRGISGFGQSGKIHTADLVDLSLDLPVIIEFFDTPEKVTQILSELRSRVEPNHIVFWSASIINN